MCVFLPNEITKRTRVRRKKNRLNFCCRAPKKNLVSLHGRLFAPGRHFCGGLLQINKLRLTKANQVKFFDPAIAKPQAKRAAIQTLRQ